MEVLFMLRHHPPLDSPSLAGLGAITACIIFLHFILLFVVVSHCLTLTKQILCFILFHTRDVLFPLLMYYFMHFFPLPFYLCQRFSLNSHHHLHAFIKPNHPIKKSCVSVPLQSSLSGFFFPFNFVWKVKC